MLLAASGCALLLVWLLFEHIPTLPQPCEKTYVGGQQSKGASPSLKKLQRDFAIFRTSAEGLPPSIRRALGKPRFGLSWSRAQLLPNESSIDAWAVPGRETICLFTRDGLAIGSTCDRSRRAGKLGLGIALLTPRMDSRRSRRNIIGIAPVTSCEIWAVRGGETVKILVNHGMFFTQDQVMAPPDQYRARDC